jgi:transposase
MAAAYSMDLRARVLKDADGGVASKDLAERYHVSRAWVDALKQRRRETGAFAPRKQTHWRTPILTPQLSQLEALIREQPDRTLAELQVALQTTACLATIWRAAKGLGFTLKKMPMSRGDTRVGHESGTVVAASGSGEGRRLLVRRARKKMDPSAAPGTPYCCP